MRKCQCIAASTKNPCRNSARPFKNTCAQHKHCGKARRHTNAAHPDSDFELQLNGQNSELQNSELHLDLADITNKFLTNTLTQQEHVKYNAFIDTLRPRAFQTYIYDNAQYFVETSMQEISIYNLQTYIPHLISPPDPMAIPCAFITWQRIRHEPFFTIYDLQNLLYRASANDSCRMQPKNGRHTGSSYLKFIIEYIRNESTAPSVIRLTDKAHTYYISGVEDDMPQDILDEVTFGDERIDLSVITFFRNGVSFYEKYGFQYCHEDDFTSPSTFDEYREGLTSLMIEIRGMRDIFFSLSQAVIMRSLHHDLLDHFLHMFTRFVTTWEYTPTFDEHTPGYIKLVYAAIETLCRATLGQYIDNSITRITYLEFIRDRTYILFILGKLLKSYKYLTKKYVYVIDL